MNRYRQWLDDFDLKRSDWYIIAQRYAPVFLEPDEAESLRGESKREYYGVWREKRSAFAKPSSGSISEGLKSLGESIDRPYLVLQMLRKLFELAVNPGSTVASITSSRGSSQRKHGLSKSSSAAEPR